MEKSCYSAPDARAIISDIPHAQDLSGSFVAVDTTDLESDEEIIKHLSSVLVLSTPVQRSWDALDSVLAEEGPGLVASGIRVVWLGSEELLTKNPHSAYIVADILGDHLSGALFRA